MHVWGGRASAAPGAAWRQNRHAALFWSALFLAATLPYAATLVHSHPDERHYVESALQMRRTGQYLRPLTPEGQPLYRKPPLAHWGVVLSYRALGFGVFATRVVSWLACGACVLLTARLARVLFPAVEGVEPLAALIMAVQPQLAVAAMRANPDALLALAMTVSVIGFGRLLLSPAERGRAACWAAYGAAGLAALAKGLLPVALVLYVLVLAAATGRGRRMLCLPPMLTCLAVATGWWALVSIHDGPAAIRAFFDDQITTKVVRNWYAGPIGMLTLGLQFLLSLLPWVLLAGLARRGPRRTSASATDAAALRFVGLWLLTGIVIFGHARQIRLRYMLPFMPLASAVLAGFIRQAAPGVLDVAARRVKQALHGLILAVGAGAVVVHGAHRTFPSAVAPAMMAGLAVLWLRRVRFNEPLRPHADIALAMLVVLPLAWIAIHPLASTCREAAMAARIRAVDPAGATPVAVVASGRSATRLRLLLQREERFICVPDTDALASLPEGSFVIHFPKHRHRNKFSPGVRSFTAHRDPEPGQVWTWDGMRLVPWKQP